VPGLRSAKRGTSAGATREGTASKQPERRAGNTARIHLNVRPGLVTVADVLEPVLATVPVEAVTVMTPDGGGTPEVWAVYQQLLRPGLDLRQLGRFEFYAACREPDVAVCVATGDAALYSNVLLTIGYLTPEGEDGPPA